MNVLLGKYLRKAIRYSASIGTILLLMVIVWGCTVPGLQEGSESNYMRLPFVRVLLDGSHSEYTVDSKGSFSVECISGDKSMVYYSTRGVTVKQARRRLAVFIGRDKLDGEYDEILFTPRSEKHFLNYGGKRFRGVFRIIPNGGNLRIINVIHLDEYLKGVVPSEIGFTGDAEFEAIKAQAVAARTYSMSHLDQYPGEPFDLRSDVADQVYNGVRVEKEIVSRAIDETRGYVMKYNDKLINAYYHSTCGETTDDIDEVWDKKSQPYLRAVPDSGFCSWSKYSSWRESYTAKQLKLRLEEYLSSERGRIVRIGHITDMEITGRTAGGRVASMQIRTSERPIVTGKDKIRWVFTRSSNPEMILQSAAFDIEKSFDINGRLNRVDFIGQGYGHGVGMCQCGAIGMSRAGRKHEDILKHYYRNVDLIRLY